MSKEKYMIARIYNRHGASDYFSGWEKQGDGTKLPTFAGKIRATVYHNHNEAYGMTIRLKRLAPTIIGGFPANYEVVEIGVK